MKWIFFDISSTLVDETEAIQYFGLKKTRWHSEDEEATMHDTL